ncbi:hypothetical protein E8L90_06215 [Brevibacillus antibioticus]|uniref:Phosphoenolpyruvate synthase n=1 Tax=Brevibacillus antibioticus TaxID=2570228 RepID=A0A4U2Y4P8_9BACL|nr:PEP/pyruvate-binding domain-containing protein [Brevibacillus antibioticus]TKI55084.1 hypothetical protein E8L90_06215 [Brevibacillus antibioticus]
MTVCKIGAIPLHTDTIYGQKAYSLSQLNVQGLNVPEGFALSTNFYTEFLNYNRFPFQPNQYLSHNNEIMDFLICAQFSEEQKKQIAVIHQMLVQHSGDSLAVRSSAVFEDLVGDSMAGLYDSIVQVCTYEELEQAVKKCYASLFSDRALSVLSRKGMDFTHHRMGVIIQKFVAGTPSGVMFTADTIEMDSDVIHVNSVDGYCSQFVDGALPSSFYKVAKQTGEVIESHLAQGSKSLSPEHMESLVQTAQTIEALFEDCQDIEWTFQGDTLYILQARTITTMRNRPFHIQWDEPGESDFTWFRITEQPYPPLVQEIFEMEAVGYHDGAYATAGRMEYYADIRNHNGYFFARLKDMPNRDEKRQAFIEYVDRLFAEGKHIFFDVVLPQLQTYTNQLNHYIGKDLQHAEAVTFLEVAYDFLRKATELHDYAVYGGRYIHEFETYCKEILEDMRLEQTFDLVYVPSQLTKERQQLAHMAEIVNQNDDLQHLFETCHYDEILYARLSKLSTAEVLLGEMEAYLKEFGLLSKGFDNELHPVLIEQPSLVMAKIRTFLTLDTKEFLHNMETTKANKQNLVDAITERLDEESRGEFLNKLQLAEKAFLTGDNHNFYMDSMFRSYIRLAVMQAGNILTREGLIERPDDVHFLRFDQLMDGLRNHTSYITHIEAGKKLIAEQKRMLTPTFIGRAASGPPPHPNQQATANPEEDPHLLTGVSGLRKNVTGIVVYGIPRVLKEDRILVLPHGHAGDIMHIVDKVKGLIFAGGAPFDHLGILSRELGIPSMYYVSNVFERLKVGDMVEIDGVQSQIRRLIKE